MRRALCFTLLAACSSTPRPTLVAALEDERCEEAALYVRAHHPQPSDLLLRDVIEKAVSYVLTGRSEPRDVIGLIAGGVVFAVTSPHVCEDLTPLSRDLRAVAGCYAERDEPGDRAIALAQLHALRSSSSIYECVSAEERELIDRESLAPER